MRVRGNRTEEGRVSMRAERVERIREKLGGEGKERRKRRGRGKGGGGKTKTKKEKGGKEVG